MKRTGFKAYVMRHCDVCNGDRPHTAKGSCVACKKRETATPGRQLYQRARALQRTKPSSATTEKGRPKPKVSPTKRAAKDALPIAQGIVRRRAKGLCEVCGNPCPAGQHHHRKPRQQGGTALVETNSASNLLWVHLECHEHLESFRTISYQRGLLVWQSADPAKVPVLLHSGWHLLADDGSMTRVNPPDDQEVS